MRFFVAFYDGWVGYYYDRKGQKLYLCPLPFCVFEVRMSFLTNFLIAFGIGVVAGIVWYELNAYRKRKRYGSQIRRQGDLSG